VSKYWKSPLSPVGLIISLVGLVPSPVGKLAISLPEINWPSGVSEKSDAMVVSLVKDPR